MSGTHPASLGAARVRRNLSGWLAGNTSSLLADSVLELALTWAAIEIGSPTQVGLVLVATVVPRIALLLFGGVLADRTSPKTVIILVDASRAVATLALAGLLTIGVGSLPVLIGYALLTGGLGALFQPAVDSLPARILPRNTLGRVGSIQTGILRGTLLAGAPVAGGLISWQGSAIAFAVCGLLFAVSAGALTLVQIPPLKPDIGGGAHGAQRAFADLATGLRTIYQQPMLIWVLILLTAANLGFSGPVTAGIPLLAKLRHWGPAAAGLLLGAFAAGSLIIAFGLTVVRRLPRAGAVAVAAVFAQGVLLAAVGISPGLAAALSVAIGLGVVNGFFGSSARNLLLTNAPPSGVARVMSMQAFAQNGVNPISFAATGAIIAAFSPATVFIAGGALTVLTAIACATRPALWRAEILLEEN